VKGHCWNGLSPIGHWPARPRWPSPRGPFGLRLRQGIPPLSVSVACRPNSSHRWRRGGGWRYPEKAGMWGISIWPTGEEEAHHSVGSTAVVASRWGTTALDRWRGRGGRRTGRLVVGCWGEAVAGVDRAIGQSLRVVDGRSSWWMEQTAQRRFGAFSLRMVA
jgi:hypothetical protein